MEAQGTACALSVTVRKDIADQIVKTVLLKTVLDAQTFLLCVMPVKKAMSLILPDYVVHSYNASYYNLLMNYRVTNKDYFL